MNSKLLFKTAMLLIVTTLVTSCADSVEITECIQDSDKLYGFWSGLWHGSIVIFSAIGTLIDDNISVYAVNNTGGWYDVGFIVGVLLWIDIIRN